METKPQKNEQLEKVRKLIGDIRIAMMTTVDEAGHLVSRPMAALQMDEDATLWCFTNTSAPKARTPGESVVRRRQQC